MRSFCLVLLLITGAFSALARTPWTSSRIQGSPGAPRPYVTEQVFGGIRADNVVDMVAADGRFYLLTRDGKLWSFANKPDTAAQDLVLDLKALHPEHDSAYSLAFHPRWRENRQIFLMYAHGQGVAEGSKVSRFKLSQETPPAIVPDSEEVLLTWLAGGHNGSQLQFGPDGCLYISTGDGKPPSPPDELNTGQDNRDLLSCILRIDVDRTEQGRAYAIPADNPFIGRPDARPEIWAFGFRNPWRISFDPATGHLWCGDVGWELWEMIHLVKRGGNYGWSAMEASQPIKPETISPLAPISPPVVAHPHTEAASITGGFVYRGQRLPELRGAYIYGDYETGKIWALWHDGERTTRHLEIADTPHRIATFAVDESGELFYVHWANPGAIYRLIPNPQAGKPSRFPTLLSETGLFQETAMGAPAPGVQEFEIAEPMWQDGAEARRYAALPGDSKITTKINRRRDGSINSSVVTWPADAVLAKTLTLGTRRVETQVLHYDGETWNGYSYRWDEAGKDAKLVGPDGEDAVVDGKRWRFHSRSECLRCHNSWSGFALAFQPQQLRALPEGLADEEFTAQTSARLVQSSTADHPLEDRARAWLHANCAHCHRRHGGGSVPLMLNIELPLRETAMVDERPVRGEFGLDDARVIAPGAPWRSVLLYRMTMHGSGRMPLIGAQEADARGRDLLWEWIATMPGDAAPPSGEVSRAMLALHDAGKADEAGLASANAHVRALHEGLLPAASRSATLGLSIDTKALLAHPGDAGRGAGLLSMTGKCATCLACHVVNGGGRDFGPDLSKIGARLTKEQLLESLLAPSKSVAAEYLPHVVETRDGQTHTGFVVMRGGDSFTLKLPTGETRTWSGKEARFRKPPAMSLMPEGLLQALTLQEAADLLAYLHSLR
jgi:putative heme-binding domain-containing protein